MDRDLKKTYIARRNADGHCEVRVAVAWPDGSGEGYALPHLVRHSPTGFEWGYHGSGPAELARCILIDWFGMEGRCPECRGEGRVDGATCLHCDGGYKLPVSYQNFKREFIAEKERGGPGTEWILRGTQIAGWVEAQKVHG